MPKVKDIAAFLEQIAPLAYQASYDNAGLVVGESTALVTNVLICLDVTLSVLHEAKAKHCNLIIAHHPIIFQPIKKLTGKNEAEKSIIYAIKHDIAIYTLHTNLDHIAQGVNLQIAQTLGLTELTILLPQSGTLHQLTTFVPQSAIVPVRQALHAAGAGNIGHYTHCSFTTTGIGSFQPTSRANPHSGKKHQLEEVEEGRLEVIFPAHLETSVIHALKAAHPYEEAAYYIQQLKNIDTNIGAGMIGVLPKSLHHHAFLEELKSKMDLTCIRHTAPITRPIKRVALCGGAGSFLIQEAITKRAEVLVTADVKYHDFLQATGQILIADIGHYESEVGTKILIYSLLSEKFTSIAFHKCETITNPIHYL